MQEWGALKAVRLESMNFRHELWSSSFTNPEVSLPKLPEKSFNLIPTQEESSIDSEQEEEKYHLFTRTGIHRGLHQNTIDIEQVPQKKNYRKKEETKGIDTDSSQQIQELFDVKSRLARRGLSSNLKDLELGIGLVQSEKPSLSQLPKLLPRGGESLLSNPYHKLKSKSKKNKKSKKKKKSPGKKKP